MIMDGRRYTLSIEEVQDDCVISKVPVPEAEPICTLMPAEVTSVKVEEGQRVSAGDVLFEIVAMKIRNVICAPFDGKILEIRVYEQCAVKTGDVVCYMEKTGV